MKYKFRNIKLRKPSVEKLHVINGIIEEYRVQGYTLTLRQLYYQLVSRDIIPNKQSEYKNISKLLKEGRMSGMVDWDAIEDRLRVPYLPYSNTNPAQAIEDTINQYRLNRQEGQNTYVEVWIEKDALSGFLKPITHKYHVRLLVNRGYGSLTAIHDAYNRFSQHISKGRKTKILYLGDHDPSGVDMIRDIEDRIKEMLVTDYYFDETSFVLEPIALTMEQINRFKPPPNPAKITDPRARNYIKKYGNVSWEVDALNPETLDGLLSGKIEESIDMELYNAVLEKEKEDKKKLKKIIL